MVYLEAATGFAAGLIAGSFMGALLTRLPVGRSVLAGRSMCDACGRRLAPIDLIPLVSFLWLRGRCRSCDAAIDPALPLLEFGAGLVGAAAAVLAGAAAGLPWAIFGWTLLLLGALDLRHYWLPDRVTGFLAASGLFAGLFAAPPLMARAIGCVAGFAALESVRRLYRRFAGREGMGGGDPKLLAAIGAWAGWQALPLLLVGASVIGLAAALIAAISGRPIDRRTRLPLGSCLAAAAILWWLGAALTTGMLTGS